MYFSRGIILKKNLYQRKRENLAEISFPAIAPTGVQTMHVNVPKHISDFATMERMPSRMKTTVRDESSTFDS